MLLNVTTQIFCPYNYNLTYLAHQYINSPLKRQINKVAKHTPILCDWRLKG